MGEYNIVGHTDWHILIHRALVMTCHLRSENIFHYKPPLKFLFPFFDIHKLIHVYCRCLWRVMNAVEKYVLFQVTFTNNYN